MKGGGRRAEGRRNRKRAARFFILHPSSFILDPSSPSALRPPPYSMSILSTLKERFGAALGGVADDTEELLSMVRRSQDPKFGDYQANLAMPLGKRLGRPPRQVAAELIARLDLSDLCEPPEVAGPGFINVRIRTPWLAGQLAAELGDPRLGVAPVARRAGSCWTIRPPTSPSRCTSAISAPP